RDVHRRHPPDGAAPAMAARGPTFRGAPRRGPRRRVTMGGMRQSQSQLQGPVAGLFDGYPALPGTYDEMFEGAAPRPPFLRVAQLLAKLSGDELARAQQLAEAALLQQGVT